MFTWFSGGSLPLANGSMANFEVPWGFQLDPLSAIMILVVTGVGFLIHIYSTGYMWDDSGFRLPEPLHVCDAYPGTCKRRDDVCRMGRWAPVLIC